MNDIEVSNITNGCQHTMNNPCNMHIIYQATKNNDCTDCGRAANFALP